MEERERLSLLKSARGHVAHYERLVEQWTHRRDHGDKVPSVDEMTRWIAYAGKILDSWRAQVKRLEKVPEPPIA